MYLEYTDYMAYGGELSETAFNRFCRRAEKLIDIYTLSRLENTAYDDIPNDVRICVFELIEYISNNFENGTVSSKTSESNDGISVSYNVRSAEKEIYGIIYTYLAESGLLYRGTDL